MLAELSIHLAASRCDASSNVSAAIANPARPAADKQQDANRKPLEVLSFVDIKVGDRVADFIPGGGYYTRLLAIFAQRAKNVRFALAIEINDPSRHAGVAF